jgi:hypothetical protein
MLSEPEGAWARYLHLLAEAQRVHGIGADAIIGDAQLKDLVAQPASIRMLVLSRLIKLQVAAVEKAKKQVVATTGKPRKAHLPDSVMFNTASEPVSFSFFNSYCSPHSSSSLFYNYTLLTSSWGWVDAGIPNSTVYSVAGAHQNPERRRFLCQLY